MLLCGFKPLVGGRTNDSETITKDQVEVLGLVVFRGGYDGVESVFANVVQRGGVRGIVEDADGEKWFAIDQRGACRIERDLRGRFRKRRERQENERDDRVLKHTEADAVVKVPIQARPPGEKGIE